MNVVVGVSGGIAAYKSPDLVRRLQDRGAAVRVILTPNAARLVSPLALAAVSGNPVIIEQWGDPSHGGVDHIELARWADVMLVAPATADILAKLAVGIADDALTTYAVAHRGPLVVAPSMNTFMLRHPTVQANLATLRARGVHVLDPDSGLLACGDEGVGRMPEIAELVDAVTSLVGPHDLAGCRILVTAGPTREPIDPVRFLSNRSSGKMGYAIAAAAARRGADVTLVSGPVSLSVPAEVAVERVGTAVEMLAAVERLAPSHEVLVMAAAVADFSVREPVAKKIKKGGRGAMQLDLERTPDILEAVASFVRRPFVVGFAAETDDVERNAREKLEKKGVDLLVANDVSDPSIGFESDSNEVTIFSADGATIPVERDSKTKIAGRILDEVVRRIGKGSAS